MKTPTYKAFTAIFEQHRLSVYNQAYRMTRSRWHAEEIVQEVFFKVWIHRNKIEEIRDIQSWLFIITRHLVFDYIVKISEERKFLATCKKSSSIHNSDALLPSKCRQLLMEAEKLLTPRQKQVYHMKRVEGLHNKDIARILNISEFTAKYHSNKSASIVKKHILTSLEMDGRKEAA